jgi:hypothetical protein
MQPRPQHTRWAPDTRTWTMEIWRTELKTLKQRLDGLRGYL